MRFGRILSLALALRIFSSGALAQETAGVGLVLGIDEGAVVVKAVLTDSPAALSQSIHPGDRLIAVAEENAPPVDLPAGNLAQTVRLLRGPKGTTVRLTIVPAGEPIGKARVISIIRGELKQLSRWGDGALLARGTKAPEIHMLTLPAKTSEELSDCLGKVVVLEFWATWCEPCQEAMAELQTYAEKYPHWKDRVLLVAASVDETPELAAKHLQAKGWSKTHNVWVSPEAIRAYHVSGIPTVYIIDQQGKVVDSRHARDIPEIVNGLPKGD